MPPKKGASKAKAAGAPAEPSATVTTAKGKEISATAAAGRSRRATAATETPGKKAASKAATTSTKPATATTKKRGRPAKDDVVEAEPPKKRGRPSKSESTTPAPDTASAKKRGRPKKGDAPAVPLDEKAPPKKRGRPPKGGETTKVEAEEEAAAEQLEEELVDAVVNEPADDEPRKRISTVKKGKAGKGRGKKAATNDVEDADGDDGVVEASGKKYWLMKAEQEDREETLKDGSVFNAKFTIDDLREKGGPEPWDGVRNPTACKNMREMKLGDLAFFYASGGKKPRGPGITGIMEIVREHEPDPSALDENSPFYVENDKKRGTAEKPRWSMVHVEFRKKLSKQVSLVELKKYGEKDSVLSQMQELNAARLSVSKVSEKEWDFIVNELIEGYEDDGDDDASLPNTAVNGIKVNGAKSESSTKLPILTGEARVKELANELPDGFVLVKETIESDAPTTDTMLPAETAATSSRPASRAGSRKASSRAGSRPGSRNGSLAPPARTTSRGRSRTPRGTTPQPMAVVAEETEVLME